MSFLDPNSEFADYQTLHSFNLERQVAELQKSRASKLTINSATGFALGSIDVVRRLPWLTHLMVVMDDNIDWSPILDLRDLASLKVTSPIPIDLSRLPRLSTYFGVWNPQQRVSACRNLEVAVVDRVRGVDLSYFSTCHRLETLVLSQPAIASLDGLRNERLLELRVMCTRSRLSLTGIGGAPNLVFVEISDCPGIEHPEVLAELEELYELRLNNVKKLESIGFVRGMKNLRGFRFVGTTVVDGDLSPLLDLTFVGFDNKKHYSLKEKQLDELLRARGGGAVVRPGDYAPHARMIDTRMDEVRNKLAPPASQGSETPDQG